MKTGIVSAYNPLFEVPELVAVRLGHSLLLAPQGNHETHDCKCTR